MRSKVYLAGPDVFLPNAIEIGRLKAERCARLGLEGLFPLDADAAVAGDAAAIFRANCALMESADAGLFNLTPFRGPSADAGTVWEVAFLFHRGKPLFGYANADALYRDRVDVTHGPLATGELGPRDVNGHGVEDFDLYDNLMIVKAIEDSGGALYLRCGAQEADPLAALDAFDACLAEAAERLATR